MGGGGGGIYFFFLLLPLVLPGLGVAVPLSPEEATAAISALSATRSTMQRDGILPLGKSADVLVSDDGEVKDEMLIAELLRGDDASTDDEISSSDPLGEAGGGGGGGAVGTILRLTRAIGGTVTGVRRGLAALCTEAAGKITATREELDAATADVEESLKEGGDGDDARRLTLALAVARKQSLARRLATKSLLTTAASVLSDEATAEALPDLYVVGMSRNVNAVVGGQEVVFDVDTLQVVPWSYAGLTHEGTNFASLVGGTTYAALGWKRKFRGSSNEEAYGGYFLTRDAGAEVVPGALGAFGVVGVSAEAASGTAASRVGDALTFNTVPDGTVTVGFGLGAGISALPISANQGSAKYTPDGPGECYGDVTGMANRIIQDLSIGLTTKVTLLAMLYAKSGPGAGSARPLAKQLAAEPAKLKAQCTVDPVRPLWANAMFRQVVISKLGLEIEIPIPPSHVCPKCNVIVNPEIEFSTAPNDDTWVEIIGQFTVSINLDLEALSLGLFVRGRLKVESQTKGSGVPGAVVKTMITLAAHSVRVAAKNLRRGLDAGVSLESSYPVTVRRALMSTASSMLGAPVAVAGHVVSSRMTRRGNDVITEHVDAVTTTLAEPLAEAKFQVTLGECDATSVVGDIVCDPTTIPVSVLAGLRAAWERDLRPGAESLAKTICQSNLGNIAADTLSKITGMFGARRGDGAPSAVDQCASIISWDQRPLADRITSELSQFGTGTGGAQVDTDGVTVEKAGAIEALVRDYLDSLEHLRETSGERDMLAVRLTDTAVKAFEMGSERLRALEVTMGEVIRERGTTVEVDDCALEVGLVGRAGRPEVGEIDVRVGLGPGYRGTIHKDKPALISFFPPGLVLDVKGDLDIGGGRKAGIDMSTYLRVYTNPKYVKEQFGIDSPTWWRLRLMVILPTDLGVTNTASVMWLLQNKGAQDFMLSLFDLVTKATKGGFGSEKSAAGLGSTSTKSRRGLKTAGKLFLDAVNAYLQQSPFVARRRSEQKRAAIEFDLSGYFETRITNRRVGGAGGQDSVRADVHNEMKLLASQSDAQFLLLSPGVEKATSIGRVSLEQGAAWWMSLDKLLPAERITLRAGVREVELNPLLRALGRINSNGYYVGGRYSLSFRYDGTKWQWALDAVNFQDLSERRVQEGRWKGQPMGGWVEGDFLDRLASENPRGVNYKDIQAAQEWRARE